MRLLQSDDQWAGEDQVREDEVVVAISREELVGLAIRGGERQLERYLDELNQEYRGDTPWTGWVETYER